MRTIILIILVLVNVVQVQGQELVFHHSRNITLEGKKLSRPEIKQLMQDTPQTLQKYKSGKTLRTVGDITFFGGLAIAIGGVLINNYTTAGDKKELMKGYGWYGNNLYHTDKSYTLSVVSLIVGGGMLVATIPLKIAGKKKIRQSVEDYNSSRAATCKEFQSQYDWAVISNNSGVGLRLTF
jgi:hypothetical protein